MADGEGCVCHAHGECECACGADWTPQELIDARAEIARLRLTGSERFVLREVRDIYSNEDDVKCNEIAAVIDHLLERLGGGR